MCNAGKVKLLFLPTPLCQLTIFCSNRVLQLLWKLELPKRLYCLLVIVWVSVLQGFLGHSQKDLELIHGPLQSLQVCQDQGLSAHNWLTGGQHSSWFLWRMLLVSKIPQGMDVYGWMLDSCCWRRYKTKPFATIMLARKKIFRCEFEDWRLIIKLEQFLKNISNIKNKNSYIVHHVDLLHNKSYQDYWL